MSDIKGLSIKISPEMFFLSTFTLDGVRTLFGRGAEVVCCLMNNGKYYLVNSTEQAKKLFEEENI